MQRPQYTRLVTIGLLALGLAVPSIASAQTAHLSMARGQHAASHYALSDVRAGAATGYRVYDCHRHGSRKVVCSADEYGVYVPGLSGDLGPATLVGMRVVTQLTHDGRMRVYETGLTR